MFTSVNTRAASAYKRVAVETGVTSADPHQLVSMLFDALLQSVARARGAMERGDVAEKGQHISKAVRLIEEGLRAGLNPAEGGDMAQNLGALYAYCVRRLTEANLRNDPKALNEVARLIEPVAQAWQDIRAQALQGV